MIEFFITMGFSNGKPRSKVVRIINGATNGRVSGPQDSPSHKRRVRDLLAALSKDTDDRAPQGIAPENHSLPDKNRRGEVSLEGMSDTTTEQQEVLDFRIVKENLDHDDVLNSEGLPPCLLVKRENEGFSGQGGTERK